MLALITMLLAHGAGAVLASDSLGRTDAVCDAATEISKNREPTRIFADFATVDRPGAVEEWRVVSDVAALHALAETAYPYTQAFIWTEREATLVHLFITSPSGDWVLNSMLCYDEAGALMRNVATLNTFHAYDPDSEASVGVSRIRTTYYDGGGQALQSETRVLDLATKDPAPQRQFMDYDGPTFMSIEDLPFWGREPRPN